MALFMKTGLRIRASLWTPQAQQQVKPSLGKVSYISEASYIFNTVTEELSPGPRLSVATRNWTQLQRGEAGMQQTVRSVSVWEGDGAGIAV